jgi:predicted helicase
VSSEPGAGQSAPTFRAMRAALLNTFDDIYVLNLNGSTKRRDKAPDGTLDQNVFDIQQGVAIALFVRRGDELTDGNKRVSYYSLRGPRLTNEVSHTVGKYEWLDAHSVANTEWQAIEPVAPYYLFVPRDKEIEAEYKKGVSLKDMFLVSGVGIVAGRDHFNFAFTAQEMEDRLGRFASMNVEEARTHFDLGKDSTAWSVGRAQADVNSQGNIEELTVPVLYRPFDKRYTYYTGNSHGFLARPTHKVNQHMTLGPNVAICTARSVEVASGWNHVLAVNTMVQHHVVSTKEVNHLFPLSVYHTLDNGIEYIGDLLVKKLED